MSDEMQNIPSTDSPPVRRRGGWLTFFLVLPAPAFVMFLVGNSDIWQTIVLTAGSGVSSLFCGFWLSRRLFPERGVTMLVLMGLLFSAVFYAVSLVLCCIGCSLGGGNLNLH